MGTENDPRPVFEGDWNSATGVEKGQHSQRVREWTARQGGKAPGRMATSDDQRARRLHPDTDAHRSADLAVLDAVIAAPKSLASDKIRAVEARQRILARQEQEERESEHGPLVALREALDLLPVEQRVDALSTLLQVEG